MSGATTNLLLPYILAAQAQKPYHPRQWAILPRQGHGRHRAPPVDAARGYCAICNGTKLFPLQKQQSFTCHHESPGQSIHAALAEYYDLPASAFYHLQLDMKDDDLRGR